MALVRPVLVYSASMFRRTFQTIDSETDGRSVLSRGLLGILVAAWFYWFTNIPVSLFVLSTSAQLEVNEASYSVDAPVAGRVASIHRLSLGRPVVEGELLLEFEAEAARLELGEASARDAAIGPQLDALTRELRAETASLAATRPTHAARLDEVRGRLRESVVLSKLATREAERLSALLTAGAVSEADWNRATAEAERRRAGLSSMQAEERSVERQASTARYERRIRIAALERAQANLRGERLIGQARIQSLRHRATQRQVRAPKGGFIGSVGNVRLGAVLAEGQPIITIIGDDELRLVAEFPPASAFGHIHPGQRALVRFDGFPPVEYGRPSATVSRVASEARDGRARVELRLDRPTSRRIPVQHGQPGQVTIEIDRATAWRLILRVIGKVVA